VEIEHSASPVRIDNFILTHQRTSHWIKIKMRWSLARFSGPESSIHVRSLAGFTRFTYAKRRTSTKCWGWAMPGALSRKRARVASAQAMSRVTKTIRAPNAKFASAPCRKASSSAWWLREIDDRDAPNTNLVFSRLRDRNLPVVTAVLAECIIGGLEAIIVSKDANSGRKP
jgi:hypothetical protein